jgi:hypothetical protein
MLIVVLLAGSSICAGGTVRTLDGKTHDGDVKLDAGGHLIVAPDGDGPPLKIDLQNVLYASFKDDAAAVRAAIPRTEDGRLPPPWVAINVGAVTGEPYARYRAEAGYSVKCQGGDIGKASDSFVFVQQPASGDADLVCRFDDVAHPTRVAAGLMFRDGSDADAPYVGLVHVAGELKFLKREKRGGMTSGGTVQPRAPFPVWVRLVRRSNTVTAFSSEDGTDWNQLASAVTPMGSAALAGMIVCTRENQPLGTHAQGLRLTTMQAAAAPTGPANLPEGLMLRTGTLLAHADIHKADGGSIRFGRNGQPDATVSNLHVGRIIFRELTPDMIARIPAGRRGILLKAGDFVEGEFKGIAGGRVQISSVLFGVQRFEIFGQAACVVVNDLEPARAEYVVRTGDGSLYMAESAAVEKDKLVVKDALAGELSIPRQDVVDISAGPGKLQPLAAIKPTKVDVAAGTTPADACVVAPSTPMMLGGVVASDAIVMRGGCAASWNLGKRYRMLTFKLGVPDGVAPTSPVRFVVLGDGKPLYKSPPRTSADAPLSDSVALKDVQALLLKVETTSADAGALSIPTPGIWADASLVK